MSAPLSRHLDTMQSRVEALEMLRQLCYDAGILTQAIEAERELRKGFGGMGVNILQESAGRKWHAAMQTRKSLDRARAFLEREL